MPSVQRQLELLAAFAGKRIAVVGDIMLDRFIYGDAERLSPEAPVPVVRLERRTAQPGGAANVAANVQSLGGEAILLGATGSDEAGAELLEQLRVAGVEAGNVGCHAGYPTVLKTRVIARGQQLLRIDEEAPESFPEVARFEIRSAFAEQISGLDGLALSDYGKGCLDQRLATELIALARARGLPVIVDPKPRSISAFAGVEVIKPNLSEAQALSGLRLADAGGEALCLGVAAASGARAAAVTAGAAGMHVLAGTEYRHIRGHVREVYDVAGAGDSTLAAMALALAVQADVFEAAWMGNLAGSLAVSHPGVVAVRSSEVQAEIEAGRGEY